MLKKLLAALGTLALVLGLVALVAGPASAHNHKVSADCVAGVSVNLTVYHADGSSTPNTVKVILDGVTTVNNVAFGATFVNTYPWTSVKGTHTYRVVVVAVDNVDPSTGKSRGYSFDTGVVSVPNCTQPIPVSHAPTPTNPYCTAAGVVDGGGYTIPVAETGISFEVLTGTDWVPVTSGAHPLPPGATVNLRAVPADGFTLTGTTTWTFTLTTPDATKCVVPVVPTPDDSRCTSVAGSSLPATYTIPDVGDNAGYKFYLQGSTTPLKPGVVTVSSFPTTVVIVAKTTGDYVFPSDTKTSWTFTFSSPGDCHLNVTPAAVAPNPAACTGPGVSSNNGYTITKTPGVIYHLSTDTTPLTAGFHSLGAGASSVTIEATAETHYVLTGTTKWPFTFAAAADCLTQIPAGDPVFVDGACDTANPGTATLGTYTVVLAEHVKYFASVNGSTTPKLLVAGVDNTAKPGDVVVITPVADKGYVISPVIANEKLSHTFAVPGDCLVKADFVQPEATSQSCVVTGNDGGLDSGDTQTGAVSESHLSTASLTSASVNAQLTAAAQPQVKAVVTHTLTDAFITIPSIADSPHAVYFIDDVKADPGKHILKPGTYKVSAVPETGYKFVGYNGPWTEELKSATPCGDLITHPLVDPSAVHVQMGCLTNGSYTLSNDLFDAAALIWTVNGSTVSQGKYQVSTVGVVTVHVATSGPSYGLEQGATTDWSFDFERPTSCDLTTLALTGSTPTGWIIFGYALLVLGLALVALRFARRKNEEA